MTTLPIREMVLYKHGLGFYVREGKTSSREIALSFRLTDMDDVLKSLVVYDKSGAKIEGVFYQTPEDKFQRLRDIPLALSDYGSLRDLLRDLRGRQVILSVVDSGKQRTIAGRMIGIESEAKGAERLSVLSTDGQVRLFLLDDLRSFKIADLRAEADLSHFLDSSLAEENRRLVTLRLAEGEHDLVVYYTAPSPTWRVSYRLVGQRGTDSPTGEALLQGWAIIDNLLDEDLEQVKLTLISGKPQAVAFDLAQAERPAQRLASVEPDDAMKPMLATHFEMSPPPPAPSPKMLHSTPAQTALGNMGELFEYEVLTPVTVKRGESSLVPILLAKVNYQREMLFHYQGASVAHPMMTLRFDNQTGAVLERGPATVIENGVYKGDVLIPFTKLGEQLYLPYAQEQGVVVSTSKSVETVFAGVHLQDDLLIENTYEVTTTAFSIENKTGNSPALTLQVRNATAVQHGVELIDTPEPAEITNTYWRWRVPLSPSGISVWQYKTRLLKETRYHLGSIAHDKLRDLLQHRLLDSEIFNQLSELLSTRELMQSLNRKKELLQIDRERVYAQQAEWRQTMSVLRDSEQETAFRSRLLKQLEASEDKLGTIERDVKTCDAKINVCEARIKSIIEDLVKHY